jgi:hypothetical protein
MKTPGNNLCIPEFENNLPLWIKLSFFGQLNAFILEYDLIGSL